MGFPVYSPSAVITYLKKSVRFKEKVDRIVNKVVCGVRKFVPNASRVVPGSPIGRSDRSGRALIQAGETAEHTTRPSVGWEAGAEGRRGARRGRGSN